MTDEELLAEKVAKRMEGLRKFTLKSRETAYYVKTVWAKDYEEAEEIANEDCDWGEAVNYTDYAVYDIREEEEQCTGTTE
jgi:hypothetical protein